MSQRTEVYGAQDRSITGDNSQANYASSGSRIVNDRSISGAVGTTSGSGNTVLGTGSTLVQSLDADFARSALDFGADALDANAGLARLIVDRSTGQTSELIDALANTTTRGQSFAQGLVGDFQNLAESSQLLARDTLNTVLNSEKFATPAATSGNLFGARAQTVALAGLGLVGLWLYLRRR